MKHISVTQAIKIRNGTTCHVLEYPFNEKDINGSVISVNGRYPETGFVVNEVCKEVVYIISGTGSLTVNSTTVDFSEGDSLFVDSGEKYFWQGSFTSYMACTPAFYPEQHNELV